MVDLDKFTADFFEDGIDMHEAGSETSFNEGNYKSV